MLKLYVWEDVLYDYTGGIAFTLANSVEEAVSLVKASGLDRYHGWDGVLLDGVQPKEYDAPIGFHVFGGG